MKFKVTYQSGLVEEVEQSDVDSIEGFINSKFGVPHSILTENGTTVELLDATGEAVAVVEPSEPAAPEAAPEAAPAQDTPAA